MIDEIQIAWVAGILEGEGTFAWYKYAHIQYGSIDLDVVNRFLDLFGGSVYNTKTTATGKPYAQWTLTGIDAVNCMKLVLPYMGIRRTSKIKEILKYQKELEEKRELRENQCKYGHQYKITGYFLYGGYPGKRCKECRRIYQREYYHELKNRNIDAQ